MRSARAIDKHLLLAPGQLPTTTGSSLGKPGEQVVDALQRPRARPVGRHLQIFGYGEIGKNLAAFWNIADAERGDTERRQARGVAAKDRHSTLARSR